ncbi:MAG: tRNA (adenosine(37)-N6)-dimethylallyltransferase MiaA, partial [Candidatus Magasanikbacteria bacterium]|nr:tRNA (adenosine(37)-N6)-dimethylallyltransferase MiaA [Candidatus Magasanikbacteria bacterium]
MAINKPKIIVIVGPTGSGKTALALALAHACGGEIVSTDSRQIYRGMDIGTGKEIAPDIPHHLIDIVNPDEEFTLADFLDRAKKVIADIHARGNVPIVVGGTGLYVQALVENWDIPAVAPNAELRAELEKKSVAELQKELAAIDPEEAERLGEGKRYLIRALEMWHATGKKPSDLKKKNEPLYDALVVGVDIPREELYQRIDARVDNMFRRGLVDEVRGLLQKYPADLPAFRTIGYREVIEEIIKGSGELPEEPLGAAPDWFPSRQNVGTGRRGESERGAPLERA